MIKRRPSQSTVAHGESFGMEAAEQLVKRFASIESTCNLDTYAPHIEFKNADQLLNIAQEFLDDQVLNDLMYLEIGQGLLLGYLWACLEWAYVIEDGPEGG